MRGSRAGACVCVYMLSLSFSLSLSRSGRRGNRTRLGYIIIPVARGWLFLANVTVVLWDERAALATPRDPDSHVTVLKTSCDYSLAYDREE